MSWFKRFLVFLLFAGVFLGCRKPTTANWNVDLVVPVAKSSLNIKNFISDSFFVADNTGLLHFKINREVAALKLDSLLNLPKTVLNYPFKTIFPFTLSPGQSFPTAAPDEIKFTIGTGVLLKRVDVKTGLLKVTFSNDLSEPLTLKYQIPNATKNGKEFFIEELLPPGQNSLVKTYDLAGYTLDMTGKGTSYNTITQAYTVALSATANSVEVKSGQGANMSIEYTEVLPAYAEGYFGQQFVDIPQDTTSLGLTDNFKASNFMLDEAVMSFSLVNEFGAEFAGGIRSVTGLNSFDSRTVSLSGNQLVNLNINRATKPQGNYDVTQIKRATKTFLYNKQNSNIANFISVLPDKIFVKGEVSLNPLGNISGYNDFAFYSTGIRVLADIDIPMRFSADYFRLKNKANVDLSGLSQLDNVNEGNFVITATNGYPFHVRLQAYMLDANNTVLDSVFVDRANTIMRGELNSSNDVVSPVKSVVTIPLTKTKIAHLKACKTIQFVTYVLLPGPSSQIQLKENYQIDIGIVAEINYNVGLKSRN